MPLDQIPGAVSSAVVGSTRTNDNQSVFSNVNNLRITTVGTWSGTLATSGVPSTTFRLVPVGGVLAAKAPKATIAAVTVDAPVRR